MYDSCPTCGARRRQPRIRWPEDLATVILIWLHDNGHADQEILDELARRPMPEAIRERLALPAAVA